MRLVPFIWTTDLKELSVGKFHIAALLDHFPLSHLSGWVNTCWEQSIKILVIDAAGKKQNVSVFSTPSAK